MSEEVLNEISDAFSRIDMPKLIRSGIILILAAAGFIIVSVVFKKLKKKYVNEGELKKKQGLMIVRRIINIFIFITALLAILQVNGINVSGFSLGIGAVTVILSFAFKDLLQDVISGTSIMIDKYFKIGDAVEYEGRDGIVVFFSVRTTKIEYIDDRSVMSVANRNITKIRKLTHLVDIDLPLSYDEPREKVFKTLDGICGDIRGIEGVESCELKGTQDFGDSAIIYKIRFFCEPHDRPDIRRAVLKAVQDRLAAADMRIPYRQLDVHEK